jgi:tetratricopeptide (TPR) repeat protein
MNQQIQNLKLLIAKVKERERNNSISNDALNHLNSMSNKKDESYQYVERGINKYLHNDLDGAFDLFDKAITLFPNADAYYNRGVIQLDRRNATNGITDFTAAILLFPEYANAYHNRAICIIATLKDYGVLNSPDCSDLLAFARQDLNKSISLGNIHSRDYLQSTY